MRSRRGNDAAILPSDGVSIVITKRGSERRTKGSSNVSLVSSVAPAAPGGKTEETKGGNNNGMDDLVGDEEEVEAIAQASGATKKI